MLRTGSMNVIWRKSSIISNNFSAPTSDRWAACVAQPADMSNPNAPASLEPGHIVAGKKNVWVGTSTEPLELLEVKAQGKKAMRAADWARGAHLDNAFCE